MTPRLHHLPGLLLTAPGRCRLRRLLLRPVTPALWMLAGARRNLLGSGHQVVAVTGSFGKTTTARALRCVLRLPVSAGAGPNSGDSLAQALIALPSGSAFSVFEVGISRRGQMVRTARRMRPSIAIVTSIGGEHSASLSTLEVTRQEKVELVRAIAPGGTAVLNGDDPNVRWMIDQAPGKVVTFGFDEGNDVRLDSIALDWPAGMRIDVRLGNRRVSGRVKLFGTHVAYSVLAALAVAHVVGLDPDEALARLADLASTPGRMQVVQLPGGAHVLRDEYKSGLETIDRALDVFAQIPGRRIIVLGEITEPPSPQHAQYVRIGQRVAPLVDRAIILGKKTESYRAGLKRGGLSADRIVDAGRNWRVAFDALNGTLGRGDVVLLKGRHDERLERIALALEGRRVGCDLVVCNTPLGRCDTCTMLEHGWGRMQPVV